MFGKTTMRLQAVAGNALLLALVLIGCGADARMPEDDRRAKRTSATSDS